MPDLHKNLKALRLQRGLTQARVAELSNISLRTYQRIESGKTSPTVEQAEQIARAVRVSFADLYR